MKKITTLFFTLFSLHFAFGQLNMSLVDTVPYDVISNDIWGYVAPNGDEYALVGLENGVSVVDLRDPSNATEVARIPGQASTWRDIKTWDKFAYVTTDQPGTTDGLLVMDLSQLPDSVAYYNWNPDILGSTLETCHNIYIDSFGVAYLAGCDVINNGGVLFIDVATDPWNPSFIGQGPPRYAHDVFTRDNKMYTSEINSGVFAIIDVTDKSNPVDLGQQFTPGLFTHNAWLSDNSQYLYTTDEVANAPIGSYDVSDPTDIRELDVFRPTQTVGSGVIPHNVHVWDDFLIVSYYTDGCILVDAQYPDNLIEVGYFDTWLGADGDYNGSWGAYPFLPSGLILTSDIQTGLYVFQPNYVRACYLEGSVKDASNGMNINNAKIEIEGTLTTEASDAFGLFKTGIVTAGTYQVTVTKPTYMPKTVDVVLQNDSITMIDIELEPLVPIVVTGTVIEDVASQAVPFAKVLVINEDFSYETQCDPMGNFTLPGFYEGTYDVYAGIWGYKTTFIEDLEILATTGGVSITLEEGIEDPFALDLGWTVTNDTAFLNAPWELGIPNGMTVGGGFYDLAPIGDSDDIGPGAYITGNVENDQALAGQGIFIGLSLLSSPVFDLTNLDNSFVGFDSWFFNADTTFFAIGPGAYQAFLTNGTDTVQIFEGSFNGVFAGQIGWDNQEIMVEQFITPTENMQIHFLINLDEPAIVEGGVDNFYVGGDPIVNITSFDDLKAEIEAFPNPTTNSFNINYALDEIDESVSIRVISAIGKEVDRIAITSNSGRLSLGADYPSGIYMIQLLKDGKESESIKLIKQ